MNHRAASFARLGALALLLSTAPLAVFAGGHPEDGSDAKAFDQVRDRYPEYLSLADGLHVTGTPIEVDISTYRLVVDGLVERPLELSFDEVRALPEERLFMSLTCPGFFTDEGYWTGVPLSRLLLAAGYAAEADTVTFTSIDGSYSQTLPLTTVLEQTVLVAYAFDDREFPVYHGFPLRIAAENEAGAVWVKWLGSITVSRKFGRG